MERCRQCLEVGGRVGRGAGGLRHGSEFKCLASCSPRLVGWRGSFGATVVGVRTARATAPHVRVQVR